MPKRETLAMTCGFLIAAAAAPTLAACAQPPRQPVYLPSSNLQMKPPPGANAPSDIDTCVTEANSGVASGGVGGMNEIFERCL